MSGRRAKAIRRAAQSATVGANQCDYVWTRHKKEVPAMGTSNTTVVGRIQTRLRPGCTRAVIQANKRRLKRGEVTMEELTPK